MHAASQWHFSLKTFEALSPLLPTAVLAKRHRRSYPHDLQISQRSIPYGALSLLRC